MSPAPFHILAIDDEAPILDLLREYLQAHGYRISTANTAAEAKRIVASDAPDLILSDLQLQETDGLQLIEEIRVTLPAVPVILLTGVLFDTQAVEQNLKWKISAYVSKTASLQALLAEIRRLIGS
jgi:DNA-binding response OmpR family regulator